MRLPLRSFAPVVLATGGRFRCHLREGDDVQQTIELAVAAAIDAHGDMTAARAGHGGGAALGGEGAGITVVAKISRVADETGCDDAGDAVHRYELRADLGG